MKGKYNRGSLALGVVLIVAGILFFVARFLGFPGRIALPPVNLPSEQDTGEIVRL
ncbi:MAG: hypothetical protein IT316_14535, partial [Anaerolineales bacterium]|nr:hypothetical protein [Anaerolineales bacterium]